MEIQEKHILMLIEFSVIKEVETNGLIFNDILFKRFIEYLIDNLNEQQKEEMDYVIEIYNKNYR